MVVNSPERAAFSTDPPPELDGVLCRALAATSVPVAIIDAQRLVVHWINRAYEQQLGYRLEDAIGLSRELVAEEERGGPASLRMAEAARVGRSTQERVTMRRGDGTTFPCVVRLDPVRDDAGEVRFAVAALQDLTQQLTHEAEQEAVVEMERRERRSVGLIMQVSDMLMEFDDGMGQLREIAALLQRSVVGWAAFYLNDGGLRTADEHHGRPPSGRGSRHGTDYRAEDSLDPRPPAPPDAVQALLDGDADGPVELDLTREYAPASASAWLRRHVDVPADPSTGRHPDAVVVVRVPGRRRTLGVLVVVPRRGEGLSGLEPADATLLELTVRRVGLAVDNARLYGREHHLAETLQRAMLPQQAEVDGLDVWTYYAPNSENVQVGGDWYDVLQIAPEVVGVVIGDVVGHDVEAAATMGQLRSVVRSYTYDITTPGQVLDRVDQLVAGMTIPRSASLVHSTLTRSGEGWRVEWSRAGHLPLIHVRGGRVEQLRDAGGALIGFGGHGRSTGRLDLDPGDVLVYYTDGLIERRDRGLRDGIAALSRVASGVTAHDAAGIGEELLSRLADHPEDDVAVVVVRVPDPRDTLEHDRSPRRRRWSLPSEPASIARARHAVIRTCQAWEMPDASNAELVVSELVANAVLHGYGHVSLQLYDTGDGLRIEVEDGNPAPPIATDGHPGRVGGFGMQIVERLADWGWRQSARGKVVWAKVRPGALPAARTRPE
nr:SpoIIE family protein phosphatase [Cellulomonas massiliensis]